LGNLTGVAVAPAGADGRIAAVNRGLRARARRAGEAPLPGTDIPEFDPVSSGGRGPGAGRSW
jgi:hypothetical protein